jgi:hypothetical protein
MNEKQRRELFVFPVAATESQIEEAIENFLNADPRRPRQRVSCQRGRRGRRPTAELFFMEK